MIGPTGFDVEAALGDSVTRLTARLAVLVSGPCAPYMAAQAAVITPPPPYVPDPVFTPTPMTAP